MWSSLSPPFSNFMKNIVLFLPPDKYLEVFETKQKPS